MFENIVGGHKPDILDCISNLSNDEVFTPPLVVGKMLDLLPDEVWKDPSLKFLDPACKTGIFLREIAKKLMSGLAEAMPDEDVRRKHIFTNMLYGISVTELTGLISRRSVYYSKSASSDHSVYKFGNEQGNIVYKRSEHTYVRGKCKFCGAPEGALDRGEQLENYAYQFIHNEKVFDMKFDVIIGNPPYQLESAGFGAQATPIYHMFVEKVLKLNPRYFSFIIPARWFSGGMGLDDFRNKMLNDRSIKHLVDCPKLFDVFPGVEIKGGVCYFLRDSQHNGNCEVTTMVDGEVISSASRDLREGGGVLVRSNEGISILDKVRAKSEKTLESMVSPINPFNLATNFSEYKEKEFEGAVKLYMRGGFGWVKKEAISKNLNWIDKAKVFTPKAGDGHGRIPMKVTGEPIVGKKGSACTMTYIVAGVFATDVEANNYAHYLSTKFVRYLISLRKSAQNVSSSVFAFVPNLDMKKKWTDEELYKRYEFDANEIEFIETNVKEMK